jgi:hypothetical protein
VANKGQRSVPGDPKKKGSLFPSETIAGGWDFVREGLEPGSDVSDALVGLGGAVVAAEEVGPHRKKWHGVKCSGRIKVAPAFNCLSDGAQFNCE